MKEEKNDLRFFNNFESGIFYLLDKKRHMSTKLEM